MSLLPLTYIEPVFRPPSEASSLILQVTNGCSWNKCTFCEMYTEPQKKFRAKREEDIEQDIISASRVPGVRRVFLADGDAMVLPFRRLMNILTMIKRHLPEVQRVSAYCLPRNLRKKTLSEMKALADMGLKILYVGAESGDNVVLQKVNKGETFDSSREALELCGDAGIKRSVMILNGLGGQLYSERHAVNSALLANATKPEFLSTLVVSFPLGEQRFRASFPEYQPLRQDQLFQEMLTLLTSLDLHSTVFRSDHASNYLVLKGVLGRDKSAMISQVQRAIESPKEVGLRQEWQRGL